MLLHMNLGPGSYDIIIERGALGRAGQELNLNRKVLVVTDEGVPSQYADAVVSQCREAVKVVLPCGEDSKSLASFEMLCRTMLDNNFGRGDCVAAVSGGLCGDLAGFSAAAYMRGIDFYNIPTTLLSQVDSSIGGKTAVNLGSVKNIVGAFWQPKKVLIDPDVLSTLEPRQLAGGMAEAIKMAATSNPGLFERLEKEDNVPIEDILLGSLQVKKYVVEQDERESGLRKILNFGHTFGHGLETGCAAEGFIHGECVAIGMLPMCAPEVRERLRKVLVKYGLPTEPRGDLETALDTAAHDKKLSGGTISCIRLADIGRAEICSMSFEEWKNLIRKNLAEGKGTMQ